MRKLLVLFLLIILVILTACGGNKVPDGMSERAYKIGMNALEIVEGYNTGTITKDEAKFRLDNFYDLLGNLDENGDFWKDSILQIHLGSFRFALTSTYAQRNTFDVEDEIKDILGVK